MKITFLGTGTSHGIPMIGCDCPACTSDDPRDSRTRSSVFLETESSSVIIDTAPEFRLQCLKNNVQRVDAVLFTHTHADHVVGLDDIRRFCAMQSERICCYGSENTVCSLRTMFSYAFAEVVQNYSERPVLEAKSVNGPFHAAGLNVIPLDLYHGRDKILGFRIDNFAYCTDTSNIPAETMEKLTNLDVLVLDALRFTPHPTHFNLEQALEAAEKIAAKRTFLTHIAHEIKHAEVEKALPESVNIAYDGLEVVTT